MKLVDLTNQKIGKLKVLRRDFNKKGRGTYWVCRCDCGNIKTLTGGNLGINKTSSCGCDRKGFLDLSGQRIEKLEVLHKDLNPKDRNQTWFICQCDCGNIKSIRSQDLQKTRGIKSCGCSAHEGKHGGCKTTEYESWKGIKRRCLNSNAPNYKDYGGRGITVCDEWIDSFETFYEDMGPKPTSLHSIDRIDNNGNYCKNNCKWSTRTEQNQNRNYNKISSKQQADEIRQKYRTGNYTQKQLGIQYNCGEQVIQYIISNKTWI